MPPARLAKVVAYEDNKTRIILESLTHLLMMQAEIQKITYEPITIRLPRQGKRCQWTGLTRSALNDLVLPTQVNNFLPPVRSNLLKTKEGSSGIRLIDFQSLKRYLLTTG